MITEEGVFSIIGPYVRLAAGGERIVAFRADEYQWRDVGRLDDVKRADEDARLIKQIV
jgi:NDP-sugar pyrophosphorylase family protein